MNFSLAFNFQKTFEAIASLPSEKRLFIGHLLNKINHNANDRGNKKCSKSDGNTNLQEII